MTLWGAIYLFVVVLGTAFNFWSMIFYALGIIWAVPAAFICSRAARKNNLETRPYAIQGGLYSALNICLWFYYLRQMRGESTYRPIIYLFYVFIFVNWLFASVSTSFLTAEVQSFQSSYGGDENSGIFVWALRVSGAASAVVWIATLIRLLSTHKRYELLAEDVEGSPTQLRIVYLLPCVFSLVFITISAITHALLY